MGGLEAHRDISQSLRVQHQINAAGGTMNVPFLQAITTSELK